MRRSNGKCGALLSHMDIGSAFTSEIVDTSITVYWVEQFCEWRTVLKIGLEVVFTNVDYTFEAMEHLSFIDTCL